MILSGTPLFSEDHLLNSLLPLTLGPSPWRLTRDAVGMQIGSACPAGDSGPAGWCGESGDGSGLVKQPADNSPCVVDLMSPNWWRPVQAVLLRNDKNKATLSY